MLRQARPSFPEIEQPAEASQAERPALPVAVAPQSRRDALFLRWSRFALVLAIFATAAMARLAEAPDFLFGTLVVLGAAGTFLWARSVQIDRSMQRQRARDASSMREMEKLADRVWELQERDERFRGLIDTLGDIVVHRDRQGRIVYANRVLAELIGVSQHSLAGRTLADLGIAVGVIPDAAFVDGEYLSSTDVVIRTVAGERWYSWIELSLRDDASNAASHRAVARDITARKRAETALIDARERAENASKAKSRFLATVSHEIRTPMNGMMGMAKLLGDTRLSPEQQTYVSAISTSADALLALIEDLLDFSKIEVGKFEIDEQPVPIRQLVENVVELLAARAHMKGIGIGSFVAPDLPETIRTDNGRLRQVLLNLIGNAIKFTDSGGVAVTLRRDGAGLLLEVRDSGPGIRQEDIDRIFLDFEQADGSSTRRHGGAGLGLSISKRIVTAMGGSIAVESEPGQGSRFSISLPLVTDEPPATVAPSPLLNRSILLLSPALLEAETIAATIRANGGMVTLHASSATLPDGIDGKGFDAVLVDAAMEDVSGKVLLSLVERNVTFARAISLIVPGERGRLPALRDAGYSNYLIRPVRAETLIRVLLSPVDQLLPGVVAPAAVPPVDAAVSGPSILIAEDNAINALLARSALAREGYRIDVVTTGKAAVDAVIDPAATSRFDLVLMDLHMPVMDGLDAIGAVRRHEFEAGLSPVPIIVLSADGQDSTRQLVLAHGATGFLVKPLDPAALVEVVRTHLAL
jgi:PAS domain S-box-containing protein